MSSFLAFSDKNTLSYRKKILTSVNPLVNHANLPVFCGFSGFRKSGHSESKKYEFFDSGNLIVSYGTHSTSDVTFAMCRVGRKIKGLRVNSQ